MTNDAPSRERGPEEEELDLLLEKLGVPVDQSLANETHRLNPDYQGVHAKIIKAARLAPKGAVICLASALELHGLYAGPTKYVWLAIRNKSRRPSRLPSYARIAWFSDEAYEAGKMMLCVADAGDVPVYSAGKTIVDCFKYRNTLASDEPKLNPVKMLQKAVGMRRRNGTVKIEEIRQYVDKCRMANVMKPYLAALDSS